MEVCNKELQLVGRLGRKGFPQEMMLEQNPQLQKGSTGRERKYKNTNRMRLTLFIGWHWLSKLYTTFQWGRLSWLLHLLKQRIPRSEATAAGGEGACLDLTSVSFKVSRGLKNYGTSLGSVRRRNAALRTNPLLSWFSITNCHYFWQNFPLQMCIIC